MQKLTPQIESNCESFAKFAYSVHAQCFLNPNFNGNATRIEPLCNFFSNKDQFETLIEFMQRIELKGFLSGDSFTNVIYT